MHYNDAENKVGAWRDRETSGGILLAAGFSFTMPPTCVGGELIETDKQKYPVKGSKRNFYLLFPLGLESRAPIESMALEIQTPLNRRRR